MGTLGIRLSPKPWVAENISSYTALLRSIAIPKMHAYNNPEALLISLGKRINMTFRSLRRYRKLCSGIQITRLRKLLLILIPIPFITNEIINKSAFFLVH